MNKPIVLFSKNVLCYLLPSLFIFIYVLIRAINIDFTFDEAWTIFDFIPKSVLHIINYTPPDTNNHIINSLSIKFLYAFLPNTPFVARIPNILALISYLYFGAKLCQRYFKDTTGVLAFLVLLLNPFALDFFGLARGYGIVLGMQMPALYYILKYTEQGNLRFLAYSFLFSALMVLANFAALYFYLGWLGVFFLYLCVKRQITLKKMAIAGSITFLLTLILWEPLRKLIEVNGFFVGGKTGFYEDTLLSLTRYSMYEMEKTDANVWLCGVFFLVYSVIVFGSFLFKPNTTSALTILFSIILLASATLIIQHHVMDSLYLVDRMALFFYPLFVLTLFLGTEQIPASIISKGFAYLFAALFVINFSTHANLNKTLTWYFDSHTTKLLEQINKEGQALNKKQKIDYSWPFVAGIDYYLKTKKYPYIESIKSGYMELNEDYDYYIYLGGRLDVIYYNPEEQLILNTSYDTIRSFPAEQVYLYKRKYQ